MYGTDDGVYLSKLRDSNQEPVKVLALLDVMQVDVLEDYQLLIVLSGAPHHSNPKSRSLTMPHNMQNDKSSLSPSTPSTLSIPWLASSARNGYRHTRPSSKLGSA